MASEYKTTCRIERMIDLGSKLGQRFIQRKRGYTLNYHNYVNQYKDLTPSRIRPDMRHLQEILEVEVLLVCHIPEAVLAVDLGACFVVLAAHGVIDKFSGQAGSLTLIAFLLLHPGDEEDLKNNNTP